MTIVRSVLVDILEHPEPCSSCPQGTSPHPAPYIVNPIRLIAQGPIPEPVCSRRLLETFAELQAKGVEG
jgi:hypothetical protein